LGGNPLEDQGHAGPLQSYRSSPRMGLSNFANHTGHGFSRH
jgi:hypothetical protein